MTLDSDENFRLYGAPDVSQYVAIDRDELARLTTERDRLAAELATTMERLTRAVELIGDAYDEGCDNVYTCTPWSKSSTKRAIESLQAEIDAPAVATRGPKPV